VVFKGGILGGARQFWGNPYLNNTTVLFDNVPMSSFCGFIFMIWNNSSLL